MSNYLNDILVQQSRRWKPNFKPIDGSIGYLECRMFEAIQIQDSIYSLSIQASPYHDCSHKDKIYDDIDVYTSFEVAFIMSYEDDYLVSLNDVPLLKDYPRLEELKKYSSGNVSLSFVPKELVEDLCKYLLK